MHVAKAISSIFYTTYTCSLLSHSKPCSESMSSLCTTTMLTLLSYISVTTCLLFAANLSLVSPAHTHCCQCGPTHLHRENCCTQDEVDLTGNHLHLLQVVCMLWHSRHVVEVIQLGLCEHTGHAVVSMVLCTRVQVCGRVRVHYIVPGQPTAGYWPHTLLAHTMDGAPCN